MPGRYRRLLTGLMLFGILLLPLAVYMETGDPSFSVKVLILRISAALVLALFAVRGMAIVRGGNMMKLFAVYAAFSLFPVLYGPTFSISFIGIYPFFAASGLTLLCIYLIFVFMTGLDEQYREKLADMAAMISLPVSLYGIMQYAGIDFLKWSGTFYPRIWSTLGNPNFLAYYLAVVLPLAVCRYLKRGRVYMLAAIFTDGAALMLTASRAGIMAAAAGLAVSVLAAPLASAAYMRRRLKVLMACLVIGVGLTAVLKPGIFKAVSGRFGSILKFKGANVRSRLVQWKTASDMFEKRPLAGGGKNSYYTYFRKYMNARFFRYTSSLSVPGYPHNFILGSLTDGGILSAGVSLIWWVAVFIYLLRNRKSLGMAAVSAAGAVSAFTVQNMFGFSVIPVSLTVWMLLGLSFSESGSEKPLNLKNPAVRALLIVISALLTVFALSRVYADTLFYRGEFGKAANMAPENGRYAMTYGRDMLMKGKTEEAEDMFRTLTERMGYSALPFNGMGNVYLMKKEPEKALEYFLQALERDPFLVDSLRNGASIYRAKEKWPETARLYERLLEVDPSLVEVRYNLGVVYYRQKRFNEAKEQWKEVLLQKPGHSEAARALKIVE